MQMRSVYVSDFGVINLTEEMPPHRRTKTGQPDRRTNAGKRVARYLRHTDEVARAAYVNGDDLKDAPPFSAWLETQDR